MTIIQLLRTESFINVQKVVYTDLSRKTKIQ